MATTLERFEDSHLPLLRAWLARPHVAPWYPRPDADLARASEVPEGGAHALIADDGVPVGYLRWQRVDRETLDSLGLTEIPAGAVDIDILIGRDDALGRGVGVVALELLSNELRNDATVPMLGLTSSIHNSRAHRAFTQAGFRIARQYEPEVVGPCFLLLRDLRLERRPLAT